MRKLGFSMDNKVWHRVLVAVSVIAGLIVLLMPVEAAPAPAQGAAKSMEFVRIQPGNFIMGCSAEEDASTRVQTSRSSRGFACVVIEQPPHAVRITKAFEMGKYEVTQAQWGSVMGSNPSNFKGADRPVESVSWSDVQAFLQKLNARNDGYRYRLPTEAEWEYAARAGITSIYPGPLDQIAWYDQNSGQETHPVGLKQPNAWGLYDMLGNVREWVQDWNSARYYQVSPEIDPPGPGSGASRLLRGGSWSAVSHSLRLSSRTDLLPAVKLNDLGFRCVREPIR